MRKNALIICCFVCAFGAFGAFFRWLQNQLAIDKETGLLNPSMWNTMVPLILIASAVLFYFLIRKILGGLNNPADMYAAFRGTTVFHPIVAWAIGGITVLGGIVTLFSAADDPQKGAITFIALLAMLSGISFPSICTASKKHLSPGLVSVFSSFPIVMFTLWLITCYMRNSSIPNVWRYGIEIICICVVIIAFYYDAGFAFGRPKPRAALYTSMVGAFMCLVSLADSRAFGMQLLMCGTAGMLLMYSWMIVSNMRVPEPEAVAEPPKEEKQEKEPEPVSEEVPVIPAGKKVVTNEPTIQAPQHRDSEVDAIINEMKSNDI